MVAQETQVFYSWYKNLLSILCLVIKMVLSSRFPPSFLQIRFLFLLFFLRKNENINLIFCGSEIRKQVGTVCHSEGGFYGKVS